MATASKTASLTSQQSMILIKNMIRISVSAICYVRKIFEDDCFKSVEYGDSKIHQLISAEHDEDTGELIVYNQDAYDLTQWLERGVFGALNDQYLKSMTFTIYTRHPMNDKDIPLESYVFDISYDSTDAAPLINGVPLMNKQSLKAQASNFVRSLVSFGTTLTTLPEDLIWLTLSLEYKEGTPDDYEPEFFKRADSGERDFLKKTFKLPLNVDIGALQTAHQEMSLRYRGYDDLELDELYRGCTTAATAVTAPRTIESTPTPFSGFRGGAPSSSTPADDVASAVENIAAVTIERRSRDDEGVAKSAKQLQVEATRRVKEFIQANGNATVKTCAQKLALTIAEAKEAISALVEEGTLIKKGSKFGSSQQAPSALDPLLLATPAPTLSSASSSHSISKQTEPEASTYVSGTPDPGAPALAAAACRRAEEAQQAPKKGSRPFLTRTIDQGYHKGDMEVSGCDAPQSGANLHSSDITARSKGRGDHGLRSWNNSEPTSGQRGADNIDDDIENSYDDDRAVPASGSIRSKYGSRTSNTAPLDLVRVSTQPKNRGPLIAAPDYSSSANINREEDVSMSLSQSSERSDRSVDGCSTGGGSRSGSSKKRKFSVIENPIHVGANTHRHCGTVASSVHSTYSQASSSVSRPLIHVNRGVAGGASSIGSRTRRM